MLQATGVWGLQLLVYGALLGALAVLELYVALLRHLLHYSNQVAVLVDFFLEPVDADELVRHLRRIHVVTYFDHLHTSAYVSIRHHTSSFHSQ